jgi:hypothetical protein
MLKVSVREEEQDVIPNSLVSRVMCSIRTRAFPTVWSTLSCALVLMALGGATTVQAIMGEDAQNRGLVLAESKDDPVLLACVLGGACRANDVFYRSFFATQIIRDGIIEPDIEIPGLGFGSIMSTKVLSSSTDTDTFCWTGAAAGIGKRQCVRVQEGSPASSFSGHIISVSSNPAACAAAEALFGQPAGFFDYVVSIDEELFGQFGAVKVGTCSGVRAVGLGYAKIAQKGVIVRAHVGLAGYDLKLLGGRYCC